jgi:hypothetical protein
MRREKHWWLPLVLTLVMPLSGCDTSWQSSRSSLSDNSRFMDLWGTYTHCYRSENLDAMREDAQRLSRAVDTMDFIKDAILQESKEPAPLGPTVRLSADPVAMAAACTLHAGHAAREMGRLNVAGEMFHMVIINFPQPRYQYYVSQARLELKHLDTANPATL